MRQQLGELPADRAIVVYCSSGYRSGVAASVLQGAGFERVFDLVGGLGAWQAASAAPA
jgi:rhodanese-related sulfurtransferase